MKYVIGKKDITDPNVVSNVDRMKKLDEIESKEYEGRKW